MEKSEYITPSKKYPVFVAYSDAFGYFEESVYKQWSINVNNCQYIGSTYALDFSRAITDLHEWLIENRDYVMKYPATYSIEYIDGSIINRYGGEVKRTKVYSISSRQAKKLLFCFYD